MSKLTASETELKIQKIRLGEYKVNHRIEDLQKLITKCIEGGEDKTTIEDVLHLYHTEQKIGDLFNELQKTLSHRKEIVELLGYDMDIEK